MRLLATATSGMANVRQNKVKLQSKGEEEEEEEKDHQTKVDLSNNKVTFRQSKVSLPAAAVK